MDKNFNCRVNDVLTDYLKEYKDTDVLTDYLKEYKIICLDREQVSDLIAFLNECLHELD